MSVRKLSLFAGLLLLGCVYGSVIPIECHHVYYWNSTGEGASFYVDNKPCGYNLYTHSANEWVHGSSTPTTYSWTSGYIALEANKSPPRPLLDNVVAIEITSYCYNYAGDRYDFYGYFTPSSSCLY